MEAYNTNVHEGRKYRQHILVFLRSARVPISSILPDNKGNESYSEYAIIQSNSTLDHQHERASTCKN